MYISTSAELAHARALRAGAPPLNWAALHGMRYTFRANYYCLLRVIDRQFFFSTVTGCLAAEHEAQQMLR